MQVLAGMACNRDATLLRWVLILPMAALLSNEMPAIGLDEINHVPDLHMPLSQIMDRKQEKTGKTRDVSGQMEDVVWIGTTGAPR